MSYLIRNGTKPGLKSKTEVKTIRYLSEGLAEYRPPPVHIGVSKVDVLGRLQAQQATEQGPQHQQAIRHTVLFTGTLENQANI